MTVDHGRKGMFLVPWVKHPPTLELGCSVALKQYRAIQPSHSLGLGTLLLLYSLLLCN